MQGGHLLVAVPHLDGDKRVVVAQCHREGALSVQDGIGGEFGSDEPDIIITVKFPGSDDLHRVMTGRSHLA